MSEIQNLSLGVSFGTLSLLGLNRASSDVSPKTAHFLSGERCTQSCAFCTQAKSSVASPNHLSRITWPIKAFSQLEMALEKAISDGRIRRICIQMVENSEGSKNAIAFLREIRKRDQNVPISVCMAPFSLARVGFYFDEGASRVGLPIDAVSPSLYQAVKGRQFEKSWDVVERAAKRYPGRISTHFIAGLGETEEEMVSAIVRANSMDVTVALFAFTPVKGTRLSEREAPLLGSYRRVQLAAYFIQHGGDAGDMVFREGRIETINVTDRSIVEGIRKGKAFETSGCPDCNRPYYNESPRGPLMNYPRPLVDSEVDQCLLDADLHLVLGGE